MPSLRLLALALCFSSFASADSVVALTGSVTNSLTGGPLARAHVTLLKRSEDSGPPAKYVAGTNAEGKFSIGKLAPGTYFITVERTGFTTLPTAQREVTLKPGEPQHDIAISLTPCGAISGRVLDAAGEPLDWVQVSVERGRMISSVSTDERGQFRIGGLAPGRYRVKTSKSEVSLPPEIRTDGTVESHYVSTYYPGGPIQVEPGSETGPIEIHMLSSPVTGIRGRIIGIPAAAVMVTVIATRGQSEPGDSHFNQVPASGSFALWRLDPGHYFVSASAQTASGRQYQTGFAEVDVAGSTVNDVELRMTPPLQMAGRLEFDDTKAREILHAAMPDMPAQILLNPAIAGEQRSSATANIDASDTFHLDGVQAGRYRVSLTGVEGVYVRSMRLGDLEIEGTRLDTGATELTLRVSSSTGSISGKVQGGKVDNHLNVALVPNNEGDDGTETFFTEVTRDGDYIFEGLKPGKYKLMAVEDPVDYEGEGQEVEIHAGEKAVKDLTWQARGK